MADDAEAGDIGRSMDDEAALTNHLYGAIVELRHGSYSAIDPFLLGFAFFDGRRDHTCSNRLRENERVADLGLRVRPELLRMHATGNGIAEFHFGIADAVSSGYN